MSVAKDTKIDKTWLLSLRYHISPRERQTLDSCRNKVFFKCFSPVLFWCQPKLCAKYLRSFTKSETPPHSRQDFTLYCLITMRWKFRTIRATSQKAFDRPNNMWARYPDNASCARALSMVCVSPLSHPGLLRPAYTLQTNLMPWPASNSEEKLCTPSISWASDCTV